MTKPGKKEPNHELAHDVIERCFHKGLLFFSPVGAWGQTVKIAPPLTITEEAVRGGPGGAERGRGRSRRGIEARRQTHSVWLSPGKPGDLGSPADLSAGQLQRIFCNFGVASCARQAAIFSRSGSGRSVAW